MTVYLQLEADSPSRPSVVSSTEQSKFVRIEENEDQGAGEAVLLSIAGRFVTPGAPSFHPRHRLN